MKLTSSKSIFYYLNFVSISADLPKDEEPKEPNYGKHITHILNSQNKNQIWIPSGFAHGFSVLSDEAMLSLDNRYVA